jgi:hypothetical protein
VTDCPLDSLAAIRDDGLRIWPERDYALADIVTILTVVLGDIARQARNEQEGRPVDAGEVVKELGNLIATVARILGRMNIEPAAAVALALQAQAAYAARMRDGES